MSKSIVLRVLPLLLLAVPQLCHAAAQPATGSERPRVGLVLGGGGARGAAHIGVLQELERLRIPIDAIAGTSMGAIVGGLYAAGMSADELEQLVRSLDWAKVLSDTPLRDEMNYRRKQDDVQYPVELELGVRDGALVLPLGVVQGQNLGLLLRDLTMNVAHIRDFDELPIPFRAVATNIESGAMHVMAGGDLAQSIRASMSVPGLLAPTLLDDLLLVDGGIVANLPVDVARAMGVDIIIAVDVEFPLYPPEELDSAPAITEQVLTILTRKETLRQIATLQPEDVLIQPQLGTFASGNFGDASHAIAKGFAAVADVEERLRELALDAPAYARHVAARGTDARGGKRLAFVRIEHDGRIATPLLASRLGVFAGDAIDAQTLADGANRVYAMDRYELVSYRLVEDDGAVGVVYTAVTKGWGPDFFNVGLSVQDDLDGSTAFNVFGRLTRTGLNGRGAEWRSDVQLGTNLSLASEFYQPFGAGLRYFVAPRLRVQQSNQNVYQDDQSIAQLRIAGSELGFDAGAELGTFGEFRTGVYTGRGELRIKIGDPTIPDRNFDSGGVFAQLRVDTFDDSRFPRSGRRANLKYDLSRPALGADLAYEKLEGDFLTAWSRGKSTLQMGLSYATTFGSNQQLQDYYPLGGFLRLSGLERGRISGPHVALGRLIYYRLVSDYTGGLFEVPVYLGASVEAGNVWQSRTDIGFDSLHTSGSLFAAFDTYFGAIYLAAGMAEGGEQAYYLLIGSPPR